MAAQVTLTHMFAELYMLQDLGVPLKGSSRIRYTCMSVSKRYIALGCNTGGVYVFGRDSLKHLQSIYADVDSCSVSVVSLSPNELNVGFAVSSGQVAVMEMNVERRCKAERLRQTSDHLGTMVTALVWDAASSSLFVGDCTGKVTHINVPTSKAQTIFRQPSQTIAHLDSGVTQVDWWGGKLLASSLTCTYLLNTTRQQFSQIGKKPREGEFGACFYLEPSCKYPVIYCARPGSRMWEVDFEGNVLNTHQFKLLLDVPPLPILRPGVNLEEALQASNPGPQSVNFVQMLTIGEFILAWSSRGLYVFDPCNVKVVLWTDKLKGVKDVCVLKNEVYIFFDDQTVRRLVFLPILHLCAALVTRQRCLMGGQLLLFLEHFAVSPTLLKHVKKELLPPLLQMLREAGRKDLGDKLQAMLEDVSESSLESLTFPEDGEIPEGASLSPLYATQSSGGGGIVVVNDGVLTFGHPGRRKSPSCFSPLALGQQSGGEVSSSSSRASPGVNSNSTHNGEQRSGSRPQEGEDGDGKPPEQRRRPQHTAESAQSLEEKGHMAVAASLQPHNLWEVDEARQLAVGALQEGAVVTTSAVDAAGVCDSVGSEPAEYIELTTITATDGSEETEEGYSYAEADSESGQEPGARPWQDCDSERDREEGDGEEGRDMGEERDREEGGREERDRGKREGRAERTRELGDREERDREEGVREEGGERGEGDREDRNIEERDSREEGDDPGHLRSDQPSHPEPATDSDRSRQAAAYDEETVTQPGGDARSDRNAGHHRSNVAAGNNLPITTTATTTTATTASVESVDEHCWRVGEASAPTHATAEGKKSRDGGRGRCGGGGGGDDDDDRRDGGWLDGPAASSNARGQLRKVISLPDMVGGEEGGGGGGGGGEGGGSEEDQGGSGWGEGGVIVTPSGALTTPTPGIAPSSENPSERIAQAMKKKKRRRVHEVDPPLTTTTTGEMIRSQSIETLRQQKKKDPHQPRRSSSSSNLVHHHQHHHHHQHQTTDTGGGNTSTPTFRSLEEKEGGTIIRDVPALTPMSPATSVNLVTPSGGVAAAADDLRVPPALGQPRSSVVSADHEKGEGGGGGGAFAAAPHHHHYYHHHHADLSHDVDDATASAGTALQSSLSNEAVSGRAIVIPGPKDRSHPPHVVENHTQLSNGKDSGDLEDAPLVGSPFSVEKSHSEASPTDRFSTRRGSYGSEVIPPLIERLSALGVSPAAIGVEDGGGGSHDLSSVKSLLTEASKQKIASVRERVTRLGSSTRSLIRRVKDKRHLVSRSPSGSPSRTGSPSISCWTREQGGDMYPADENDDDDDDNNAVTSASPHPLMTSRAVSVDDLLALTSDTLGQLGQLTTLLDRGALRGTLNAWAAQLHTALRDHAHPSELRSRQPGKKGVTTTSPHLSTPTPTPTLPTTPFQAPPPSAREERGGMSSKSSGETVGGGGGGSGGGGGVRMTAVIGGEGGQTREVTAGADRGAGAGSSLGVASAGYGASLADEERNGELHHHCAESDRVGSNVTTTRLELGQREEEEEEVVVVEEESGGSGGGGKGGVVLGESVGREPPVTLSNSDGGVMSTDPFITDAQKHGTAALCLQHKAWTAVHSDPSDTQGPPTATPTPTRTHPVEEAEDISVTQAGVEKKSTGEDHDRAAPDRETSPVDRTLGMDPLVDWTSVCQVKDPFGLSPQQLMAVSTLATYCLECRCFGNALTFFGLGPSRPQALGSGGGQQRPSDVSTPSSLTSSTGATLGVDGRCLHWTTSELSRHPRSAAASSSGGDPAPPGEIPQGSNATTAHVQKGKAALRDSDKHPGADPGETVQGSGLATTEGGGTPAPCGSGDGTVGGMADEDDAERALFVRLYYPFLPYWRLRQLLMEGETSAVKHTWRALVLCCQALGGGDAVRAKTVAGDVRGALDCLRSGALANKLAFLGHVSSLFASSPLRVTDFLSEVPRQVKLTDVLHLCHLHSAPVLQVLTRYLALRLGATPTPARLELLRDMCTCSEVTLEVLKCLLHLRTSLPSPSTSSPSPSVWAAPSDAGWRGGGTDASWPSPHWVEDTLEGVVSLVESGDRQGAALEACYEHSYWPGCLRLLKQSDQWQKALELEVKLNDINLLNGRLAYGFTPRNEQQWEYLLQLYQQTSLSALKGQRPSSHGDTKDDPNSDTAGQSAEDSGRGLSWLSLGRLAAQHLGTRSAAQLLQACCKREEGERGRVGPGGEEEEGEVVINPHLYTTYLALSALHNQQQLVIHNMLEKVDSYLWAKKPVHLPPQVHYAMTQEKSAMQNSSRDDDSHHNLFSRLSAGSMSWNPLAEDPDCHWGVYTNIHRSCAVCGVEVTETVSHLEPGMYTFRCGHLFHKFCVQDKACPLC